MNLISNLKKEIRNRRSYFIIVTLIIFIYALAIYFIMYSAPNKGVINMVSTLDGEGGITGNIAFMYLYIPIVFFGINSYTVNNKYEVMIIKMKSRKFIFNRYVIFIITISLIISIIMVFQGNCFGVVYAEGYNNLWPRSDLMYTLSQYANVNVLEILNSIPVYEVIIKTLLIKFLGLLAFGLLILILENVIGNTGILLVVVMGIAFIDSNFLSGALIMQKVALNIECWISSGTYLLNVLYLNFLSISLYLIGRESYKNKDFIGRGY